MQILAMCQEEKLRSLPNPCLTVALGEVVAVGLNTERLRIEERLDVKIRIVRHEQARLEPGLLNVPKLRQCRRQN